MKVGIHLRTNLATTYEVRRVGLRFRATKAIGCHVRWQGPVRWTSKAAFYDLMEYLRDERED